MVITLPSALTVHDIAALASGAPVAIDADARREIERHFHAANEIAALQPVYGRTTGVGANRLTETRTDPITHGMNLLRSHAVDAGPQVDAAATRAMLVVRLNQLLQPGSGIEPAIIDGLGRMLTSGALPDVRRYGSIGTADLTALAGTALTLVGERPALGAPFEPIGEIRSDSALPFMSSSALTLGEAALTAAKLERLLDAGNAVFALSALAARANPAAFSREAALAVATPTAIPLAGKLASILDGVTWEPRRIQDPFAFRGYLPAESVLRLSTSRLREAVESLVGVSQENPRFFPEHGTVIHHGAFLQNWLAHELDTAAIGLAQAAPLGLSRIRFLNDDSFTGLPRFLAPELGGNSGTMIVEYVAASALGEVHAGAAPVSTQGAVLSCGVEEDATFAGTALGQLARSIDGFETMLAAEILVAVRALRLRGPIMGSPSVALSEILELVTQLPSESVDRDLRGDLEIANTLLEPLSVIANSATFRVGVSAR